MEETVREVLYETRYHASRPFPSDFTRQQAKEAVKGGLLSLISTRGIKQLKEKWSEYRRPRTLTKPYLLFISSRGDYIAVAVRNQITILRKDDDYREPCGIFTSDDKLTCFTHGAWSDSHDVLGVIDFMGTVSFIRSNGEEITRITKRQLKMSASIISLIALDDSTTKVSCLCSFSILTSDGLLHDIEVGQDPSAVLSSLLNSTKHMGPKKQFPQNFSCLDFRPDLSLLVLVDGTGSLSENPRGSYCLSIWRMSGNSELVHLFSSSQFEGLFSPPKGHTGPFTTPKVQVSAQGKYIAVLNLTGSLDIFALNTESCSLSIVDVGKRCDSQKAATLSPSRAKFVHDTVDFTWWSDRILVLAKRSGVVTMLDIFSCTEVLKNGPVLSMPVLENVQQCQGCIFILETSSPEREQSLGSSDCRDTTDLHDVGRTAHDQYNQLDVTGLHWSLISFTERSVSEMYTFLIRNQQYQAALELANCHGLDFDDVFKSQWLHSNQGAFEIKAFLSNIKDQMFILSECLNKIGPTEDAVKALLSYGISITEKYRFSESEYEPCSPIWKFRMIRLQLLQCRDRLETFVGINMGRFSAQEYGIFRTVPLNEAAVRLAESGKIGALNLLFKRHLYSLAPFILVILGAIPETVPAQTYSQLLPGRSPPSAVALRERDWVECEKMMDFFHRTSKNKESTVQVRTELMIKQFTEFVWPSAVELSLWYKNRARDIDCLSGLLDNSLTMVEIACQKGIMELQQYREDISYLAQLIYSDGCDEETNFSLSLLDWEQLSDYEKFKMMLKGVNEETVVTRLQEKAMAFMRSRSMVGSASDSQMGEDQSVENYEKSDSCLVKWMKETASENQLDVCLVVIEEGCKDMQTDGIFRDEVEAVETALNCVYLCTLTDRWNAMASTLSKLPQITVRGKAIRTGKSFSPRLGIRGFGSPRLSMGSSYVASSDAQKVLMRQNSAISTSGNTEGHLDLTDIDKSLEILEKRVKLAEGHIEAGRLLAYYQVPKPMSFFLTAATDEKGVKQLLRLILSKFGRRQPGRSDSEWANMWRDMQCLQEKAFPFLDIEYMLIEFCRGLLKAGKFSLARNYLKGTGSVSLATEKAENLVIQAAREYFFSASSLACTEIWRAKECLNLFPNSGAVKAEADIIDAVTVKLPRLGVTLLPMQFRQIKNPMEIINMVITNQSGAYLDVDELIQIAQLLGLSSQDDIAAVQEAVAREAAVSGDLQLAFDLCLVLAKKGHGSIWDLCAAIARGPVLENMDMGSRKKLLGFALSNCDEESISELLLAWKDLDIQIQCEKLTILTGTNPPNFSVRGSSIISPPAHSIQDIKGQRDCSEMVEGTSREEGTDDVEAHFKNIKDILSAVVEKSTMTGTNWDSYLREHGKLLSFAALQLPWLLELSNKEEYGKNISVGATTHAKPYLSVRTQAIVCILSWLARNDIAPRDEVVASLAKSVMEPPVTEEEDFLGCSFLLNLVDAFHGVKVIEEQLKTREGYQEICSIMNIGMTYSSLHDCSLECTSPTQRRKLLLQKFQEKHSSLSSDAMERMDKVQSTFWNDWKSKLEEQKLLADQARELEKTIPGVETARFLSGDRHYIESCVFSFADSAKLVKKPILKEALKLASTYSLNCTEVLLRFLGSALVSKHWENDDIVAEVSEYKEEILSCAAGVINLISTIVYPAIDGCNKQRLALIYSILSDCYFQLKGAEEPTSVIHQNPGHTHTLELFQFYKVLEQVCRKISYIKTLNFKNIAGLGDLNFEHFNTEVYSHIQDACVDDLAKMVETLVGMYKDSEAKGLISWQAVYKHHVECLLKTLDTAAEMRFQFPDDLKAFLSDLEQNYDCCRIYIRAMSEADISDIIGRYYKLSLSHINPGHSLSESAGLDSLLELLNFWVRLADDTHEIFFHEKTEGEHIVSNSEGLSKCLKVFRKFVIEGHVSANQGWATVSGYGKLGLMGAFTAESSTFCRSMVFSGCGFRAVAAVFLEAMDSNLATRHMGSLDSTQNLSDHYLNMIDSVLLDLGVGCGDKRSLHYLLRTLSKLEGNLEDLGRVRHAVWGRLIEFSDNMQLQSHTRVYVLELMQCIAGRNLRGLPAELLSDVQPWEGWDESRYTATCETADQAGLKQGDTSSKFANTLVALKSTQLIRAISPSIEITADDLMSPHSALSCFLRLSAAASCEPHYDTLQAILEEWEGLFTSNKDDESGELPNAGNNWGNDEWDEGWESFQEEPIEIEGKKNGCDSVHPLHACWMEMIRKLVSVSRFVDVTKLIDHSLSKSKGILLDEEEAQSLSQLVIGIDCFMALKIMLLLPYEAIWLQCLSAVESNLKDDGISDKVSGDYELFSLMLSSGVVTTIITDTSYRSTFSYFCYSAGHLSCLYQEHQLSLLRQGGEKASITDRNGLILFGRILFPCFISELVIAKHFMLAGFLVCQFMHTHASLCLVNIAEASLRRYLEGQIHAQQSGQPVLPEMNSSRTLPNTIAGLRCKLGTLPQAALSALPINGQ